MNNVTRGYENFSYFEQFSDMEIDLSRLLSYFSTDEYELKFDNTQPVIVKVKNLFEQFKIINNFKNDISTFNNYDIVDGERVETVSYKFYDTVDYWWIIYIFNEIKNPFFDWPLTESQIINLADTLSTSERRFPKDVYYNLIFDENEKRRNIIIPKKEMLSNIVWAFRSEIKEKRK